MKCFSCLSSRNCWYRYFFFFSEVNRCVRVPPSDFDVHSKINMAENENWGRNKSFENICVFDSCQPCDQAFNATFSSFLDNALNEKGFESILLTVYLVVYLVVEIIDQSHVLHFLCTSCIHLFLQINVTAHHGYKHCTPVMIRSHPHYCHS